MKIGIVSSRFQILHLKHIEYILAAKMRCKRLYIGIEVADDLYVEQPNIERQGIKQQNITQQDIEQRTEDDKLNFNVENPLTYIERHEMLCQALLEFGMEKAEFDIVPFPIQRASYVLQYIPRNAIYFLGISTEMDKKKKKALEELGVKTEVLWKRDKESQGITEKEVLDMIIHGGKWESQVPKSTVKYMKKEKLVQKIKNLEKKNEDKGI